MIQLRVLDLFSGIGGFSLGLERTGGFKTVAFCEIEEFPRKVLAKHWPGVPCYHDVRTLNYDGAVDVITGGYPCQPFSTAGKRQGQADDRHLWPAMFSLIKKHRPTWVIGENVAGHVSMGLDAVLADLASEGYACRTFIIPACAVDARHRRDRVWIVAHADSTERRAISGPRDGLADQKNSLLQWEKGPGGLKPSGEALANPDSAGLSLALCAELGSLRGEKIAPQGREPGRGSAAHWRAWPAEPGVGRVAARIPNRVDRLKTLGNAVVPQIPELIGNAILQSMRGEAA